MENQRNFWFQLYLTFHFIVIPSFLPSIYPSFILNFLHSFPTILPTQLLCFFSTYIPHFRLYFLLSYPQKIIHPLVTSSANRILYYYTIPILTFSHLAAASDTISPSPGHLACKYTKENATCPRIPMQLIPDPVQDPSDKQAEGYTSSRARTRSSTASCNAGSLNSYLWTGRI